MFGYDPETLQKCIEYIKPRSYGVFFSYLGVSLIAFYTGIAKTSFIIYDTIVLIVVNLILNYVLVFGKFGFQPMGIAGAALASTLAEVVAFIVFIGYMIWDKSNRKYELLSIHSLVVKDFKNMFSISTPIVFQSILGIGSWFLFFSFIENVGSRELEISNLLRTVYLILSIPCWGYSAGINNMFSISTSIVFQYILGIGSWFLFFSFIENISTKESKELEISNLLRTVYLILSIPCWGYSAGINTMVSNFIGNKKRQAVFPLIIKTVKLNLLSTMLISLPVLLFPEFFLYPLFGKEDMTLILLSKPYMLILFVVLMIFSIGGIFINGLIGTGHTQTALRIQTIFTIFYIIYSYFMIKHWYFGLNWAWAAEIFYWGGITIMSLLYLKTKKWHFLKF